MSRLEVRQLTKRYRGTAVVDDVSFRLDSGEVVGYLGPNGSGKSTTVKMLAGLVEPSSGEILFNDTSVRTDLHGFKQQLGYVPEGADVYPSMTAAEYLTLIGRLRGLPETETRRKSSAMLELFGLHLRRHSPLASYSKGMRQRVLITAALLHDPEVLILDEPLSGLDVSSAMLMRHLLGELASRGKIILYISHVLEVVERVCTRSIILYKGRVVAEGGADELRRMTRLPSLERVFMHMAEQDDGLQVARDIVDTVTSAPRP